MQLIPSGFLETKKYGNYDKDDNKQENSILALMRHIKNYIVMFSVNNDMTIPTKASDQTVQLVLGKKMDLVL